MKFNISKKDIPAKQSKAYKLLSVEEKLIYEYCLYKGADGKEFEVDYDEFIKWMCEMTKRYYLRYGI